MISFPVTSFGGYTCVSCGQWSPNDVTHLCNAPTWRTSVPVQDHHAYKCPVCGGEFDEWYRKSVGTMTNIPVNQCPFCSTLQGKFPHLPLPQTWKLEDK